MSARVAAFFDIDKTVLEKLGDPLVHIVRNSIDHGIEGPDERLAAGKPAHGTITIRAEHRGSAIVIEVSDDGRGLNYPRILQIARERGLVAADAQLRDDEIAQLVFQPGFSTAQTVSDISGRGVGMDVVWRHLKEVGGDVHLESSPGQGTRTTLRVPLTLAIIPALVVSADHDYTSVASKEAYVRLMPNARLAVVADSRHALPMERADEFNAVVAEFLATVG